MKRSLRTSLLARVRTVHRSRDDWFRPCFELLESRHLLSVASGVDADDFDVNTSVTGRRLFYNNSAYDLGFASDSSAIATDKVAYIPNGSNTVGPQNVSSYVGGINGIMVEITGTHGTITAADFTVKMSLQGEHATDTAPGSWAAAPSFTVTSLGAFSGADRYALTWADGAIKNRYVEVITEGNDAVGGNNANTGLATSDYFFYGNIVGESFNNFANDGLFVVDQTDEIATRFNQGFFSDINFVQNPFDYNRDFAVDQLDEIIARFNGGFLPALSVSAPALSAALTADTGPNGVPNTDGVTSLASVSGTLTAANGIGTFQASLNSGASFNALSTLSGSNFTLSQSFLTTLNGGPLVDGPLVVHLRAVDAAGIAKTMDVAFTLKRSIATPLVPDLIAADDTGSSSTDDITKIIAPHVNVTAETGSSAILYVDGVGVHVFTGAPGLQFALPGLSNAMHSVWVVAQDGAGNSATSPTLSLRISSVAPAISIATLVTVSSDLTPHVTVSASDPLGLANGTLVTVDVDMNYDGSFSGSSELNRTTSDLFQNNSFFQVTPALPASMSGVAYNVQLRARVTDLAGNEGTSAAILLRIDRIGNNVLDNYVTPSATPSYTFNRTLVDTTVGFTSYVIDLKSQTWRSTADVNKPDWHHWVQIVVPTNLNPANHSALLFIDGGNNISGPPTSTTNSTVQLAGFAAVAMQSVVVYLPTVPSEPLTFVGDTVGSRSEDAIIAYTLDKYADNLGAPGNETWPLLLPMVQSAVSAMDLAQVYVPTKVAGYNVSDFVVTGFSKRGWTTWLTAAMDNRVRAIMPGVIDILNMGEQMVHHWGAYNDFSYAIGNYEEFNIPQQSYTSAGQAIGKVVDPYMYIYNGRFDNMPKLLIGSTGDEFFLPDAAEYYFSDLPGTKNYLRYIPNTSHSLDSTEVGISLVPFFIDVAKNQPLPQFNWTVGQDGKITVHTITAPLEVSLYQATNPAGRDFRKPVNPTITWTSSPLTDRGGGTYIGSVTTPASPAATAYFVQLKFASSTPDTPHVFTTQIAISTQFPLYSWPFFMPSIAPPAAPLLSGSNEEQGGAVLGVEANAVAVALASAGSLASSSAEPNVQAPRLASGNPSPAIERGVDQVLASTATWADDHDDVASADEEPAEDFVLWDDEALLV